MLRLRKSEADDDEAARFSETDSSKLGWRGLSILAPLLATSICAMLLITNSFSTMDFWRQAADSQTDQPVDRSTNKTRKQLELESSVLGDHIQPIDTDTNKESTLSTTISEAAAADISATEDSSSPRATKCNEEKRAAAEQQKTKALENENNRHEKSQNRLRRLLMGLFNPKGQKEGVERENALHEQKLQEIEDNYKTALIAAGCSDA